MSLTQAVWKALAALRDLELRDLGDDDRAAVVAASDALKDAFAPCDGCRAVEVKGKVLLVDTGDVLCPSCHADERIRMSVAGFERGSEAAS